MERDTPRRLLIGALAVLVLSAGMIHVPEASAQVPGCETAGSADPSGIAESWKVCEAVENFRWCQQWGQDQIEDVVGEWSDWARQQVDQARDMVQDARCEVVRQLNEPPEADEPTAETPYPDIGETATYCTTATDPNGEQTLWVRFKFINPDVRSSTSTWQEAGSGETVCETHAWQPHQGYRKIKAQARDKFERSGWSTPEWDYVRTRAPDRPDRPTGPDFVWDTELSGSYTNYPTYCASSSDPDGDSVEIAFSFANWWHGTDATGEACDEVRTSWSPGWASVEAKARDQHGETSDWSPTMRVEVGDNDEPSITTPTGPEETVEGNTDQHCADFRDGQLSEYGFSYKQTDGNGRSHSGMLAATSGDGTYCYQHTWDDGPGNYCVSADAYDSRYGESSSGCHEVWVEPAGWDDCGSGTDAGETRGDAYAIDPDVTCLPPSDGDCVSAPAGTCLDHEHRPSSDDGSDRDWYEFHADGGQTIDAHVDSCSDSGFHDMQLLLVDPTGDTVRNEWQNNCREEFSFPASEGGTYRLAINGRDGDGGWDMIPYELHVEVYW